MSERPTKYYFVGVVVLHCIEISGLALASPLLARPRPGLGPSTPGLGLGLGLGWAGLGLGLG